MFNTIKAFYIGLNYVLYIEIGLIKVGNFHRRIQMFDSVRRDYLITLIILFIVHRGRQAITHTKKTLYNFATYG